VVCVIVFLRREKGKEGSEKGAKTKFEDTNLDLCLIAVQYRCVGLGRF